MHATTFQADLRRALAHVGPAIRSKSTLPVLANVLLRGEEVMSDTELSAVPSRRLVFQATDLETSVTTWIDCQEGSEFGAGAVTLPWKSLSDLIGTLNNAPVAIAVNDTTVTATLTSGRSECDFQGIDAEEYPTLPTFDPLTSIMFHVKPETFREAIKRVAYAAADNDTRPVLAGISFVVKGKTASLSTTDGFRLATTSFELDDEITGFRDALHDDSVSFIMPAGPAQMIAGILDGETEPLTISIKMTRNEDKETARNNTRVSVAEFNAMQVYLPSFITVHSSRTEVGTRLIAGRFPDYQRIIPRSLARARAVIDRTELLRLLKQVRVFAKDSANIVMIEMTPGDERFMGTMVLSALAAERGKGRAEVDIPITAEEVDPGVKPKIQMNIDYMIDAINALPNTQVSLSVRLPASPLVVTGVGNDTDLAVIMPMTVK